MLVESIFQRIMLYALPSPDSKNSLRLCWLQLTLLCLLTACPTSSLTAYQYYVETIPEGKEVDHHGRLYWIQDITDGKCVGPHGMGNCGDGNIWGVRGEKGKYMLETMAIHHLEGNWVDKEPGLCLDRTSCHRASSDVRVSDCGRCGTKHWEIDVKGRVSQDRGLNCLVRNSSSLTMQHCKKRATKFTLVEYVPLNEPEQYRNISSVVSDPFIDPASGMSFPSDMSVHLGEKHKGQIAMGAGLFRFLGYGIYGVAYYMDAEQAQKSPSLQAFKGMTAQELARNQSFYAAMMNMDDKYDRSIYIKLLIPLKASTVKASLEAEWNMNPLNKKILLDNSFRHARSCCSRGTELLFTWHKSGVLDVRLNNRLLESFPSETLAQDLFYQYVCEDPISPQAKKGFTHRFPELLEKGFASLITPKEEKETASGSGSDGQSIKRRSRRRWLVAKFSHRSEEEAEAKKGWGKKRYCVIAIITYCAVMVLSLPASRRRFVDRLKRGGGSWRWMAIQVGIGAIRNYSNRLFASIFYVLSLGFSRY